MNVDKIREDFPVLRRMINNKPVIYFDSACMSLRPKQVIDAMDEYYEKYPACAGRSVHKFGNEVTEKYRQARETISKFIGAKKTGEIIFTKNTTEGINLLSHSLGLGKGDIVLTTDREHNSNLLPWQVLSKKGVKHKIVYSNSDMSFDIESFEKSMDKNVKLVSMVHTSNLDGYTIPAEEIVKIAHDYGALVLLDGAQSVPHKPVNVKKLDADFLVFSGHKMLGPSGTGVLYGKHHLLENMEPFMTGGDTVSSSTYDSFSLLKPPEKFEAGLQNYAGAMGLAAASRYLEKIGMSNIERHEEELGRFIRDGISGVEGLEMIGHVGEGGIVSFSVKGMNVHDIAIMLDETKNIMIRSGQHCVHSWFNAHGIEGSARASLYLYNTKEEAEIFVGQLEKVTQLR